MTPAANLRFNPLGDQAVLIQAADEADALAVATAAREQRYGWAEDIVQSYASVAVFYRPDAIDYGGAKDALATLDWPSRRNAAAGKLHQIPCCYELGMDFDRITRHTGLTRDDVIAIHCETTYTVYAIGFCPGFPYLGYLPEQLAGVPRLESPRLKVEAGSVGLTGRQTGIYTEARPGGWNIVGRTPLELVNVADEYFPIRTGDRVRFQRIDEGAFRRMAGERLAT
ncbi:MAG: allophanate hydrolase subunit 1 [Gemmataceae bacterium]|nr:allophanate hydrolase subunit 1 [Gemmataceae bacterium]